MIDAEALAHAFEAEVVARDGGATTDLADIGSARCLYVSSDLRIIADSDLLADHGAHDLTQVDDDGRRRAYRRLDARWLAWLEAQMHRAWRAHQLGRLADEPWQDALHRYRVVKSWAQHHLGATEVEQAICRGPAAGCPVRAGN